MKFFVLINFILYVLCVDGKGWNPENYTENCSEGYFSEWISYLKRFSLVVLTLSGVILYYIPDSRSIARKGCCFMIDSLADGLKTILCLKENNTASDKKKIDSVDSFFSGGSNTDLCENVDFEYMRHHKDEQELRLRQERREVSRRIRANSKHHVSEKSTSRYRHHQQRLEKSNRHMRDVKDSSGDNQFLIQNYERVGSQNRYSIADGSSESSAMCSPRNGNSCLIRNPQQMDVVYGKNDVNIHRKLYPVVENHDVKWNRKNDGLINGGIVNVKKELKKRTSSAAKVKSNKKSIILNQSGLGSTCDARASKDKKKLQSNKEFDNKQAEIYYERTPRLKEMMNERNSEIKYMEKAARLKKSKELLKAEKTDENESHSTGAELLYELGDQIDKLDLTIKMIRPSSKKRITDENGKEEYALKAVESVLKDIKRGYQMYDDDACQRKVRTLRSILSEDELNAKREIKSVGASRNEYIGDQETKLINRTVKEDNKKKGGLLEEKINRKKEWRSEEKEELSYSEDDEDEEFSGDGETTPISTNQSAPFLFRAAGWLFGGCPHANKVRSASQDDGESTM